MEYHDGSVWNTSVCASHRSMTVWGCSKLFFPTEITATSGRYVFKGVALGV